MIFAPVLVTPPASLPVSLADLKEQIPGLSFDDDDTELTALLNAAVGHFDGYSGTLCRCIVSQTWRQHFDGWSVSLRLPFPDVSAVVVKYLDTEGAEQTVASEEYELVTYSRGGVVCFREGFSSPNVFTDTETPVWVDLTAGFSTVPEPLKQAIIMLARSWYEGDDELPMAIDCLAGPFRVLRL